MELILGDSKYSYDFSHFEYKLSNRMYKVVELSFEFLQTIHDSHNFIDDSYLWYITYDGPQPSSLENFDINKVCVISVFRKKFGLKCVAIARKIIGPNQNNKEENRMMRDKANAALNEHIKFICSRGWAEVSDPIETKFYKLLGYRNVVDPYDLLEHKVFRNMKVDVDEYHYWRPLRSGESPTMNIAYGTTKF